MKYTTLITLSCLSLVSPLLLAQQEIQISKHAVELDLLNFDKFYNLNYERAFIKNKWAIIPKAGIYIHPFFKAEKYTYQTPNGETKTVSTSLNAVNFGLDFLYGIKKHFLRLGINTMVERDFLFTSVGMPDYALNYAIQPAIGYRFQKDMNGLFFTSTLRPFMLRLDAQGNESGDKIRVFKFERRSSYRILLPSLGLGYSF